MKREPKSTRPFKFSFFEQGLLRKKLTKDVLKKIRENFKNMNEPEKRCFLEMLSLLPSQKKKERINSLEVIIEILKGGQIQILDEFGEYYDKWKQGDEGLVKERISSHHRKTKTKQEYGIYGKFLPQILIGTLKREESANSKIKKQYTFFQLEANPWDASKGLLNWENLGHAKDCIQYLFISKGLSSITKWVKPINIGPFGKSIYTDWQPYVIDKIPNNPEKEENEKCWAKNLFLEPNFTKDYEDKEVPVLMIMENVFSAFEAAPNFKPEQFLDFCAAIDALRKYNLVEPNSVEYLENEAWFKVHAPKDKGYSKLKDKAAKIENYFRSDPSNRAKIFDKINKLFGKKTTIKHKHVSEHNSIQQKGIEEKNENLTDSKKKDKSKFKK